MEMTLFRKWSKAGPAAIPLGFDLLIASLAAGQTAGRTGNLAARLAMPCPPDLDAAGRLVALLQMSTSGAARGGAVPGSFHPGAAHVIAACNAGPEMKGGLTLTFQASFKAE